MTDTVALKEKISMQGLKMGYIADQLGITREALSLKVNNQFEFKASEIAKLTKILRLNQDERDTIFFSL